MKPARKLVLKRESLAELGADDLRDLAGAQATPNCPSNSYCFPTWDLRCRISQLMYPCPTDPTLVC